MTEKITTRSRPPADGVLRRILVPVEREVPVGEVLGVIASHRMQDAAVLVVAQGERRRRRRRPRATPRLPARPAAPRRNTASTSLSSSPRPATSASRREDVLAYVAAHQAEAPTLTLPQRERDTYRHGLGASACLAGAWRRERAGAASAGMRKMIADHMFASLRNTAQITAGHRGRRRGACARAPGGAAGLPAGQRPPPHIHRCSLLWWRSRCASTRFSTRPSKATVSSCTTMLEHRRGRGARGWPHRAGHPQSADAFAGRDRGSPPRSSRARAWQADSLATICKRHLLPSPIPVCRAPTYATPILNSPQNAIHLRRPLCEEARGLQRRDMHQAHVRRA